MEKIPSQPGIRITPYKKKKRNKKAQIPIKTKSNFVG
jgi:hypothetical protein